MDNRKSLILDALRAFINQRSGIEFGNYGDVKAFRAEQRGIQKDRHEALELLRAVELSSGIDADALLRAANSAYSGRLTILEGPGPDPGYVRRNGDVRIDYCTGQYFPTEYRRAACAVLASALWEYTREHCMPQQAMFGSGPNAERKYLLWRPRHKSPDYVSAGDWLRAHFLRQFGRGIASRWFT